MYDMGFHEVAKYLMLPYHQRAYNPCYAINVDLWNELPADLKAILRESVNANTIYMRSFYAGAENETIALMREAGVTVVHLPEEDVATLREATLKWLQEEFVQMSPRCARATEIVIGALKTFGSID